MVYTQFVLIGCFCSGVVSALIATSKDRSIPGFFVIGFLFGVFGVIFAACVKSYRPTQQVFHPQPVAGPVMPAGWFPDPHGSGGMRWFNGTQWSWQTAPPSEAMRLDAQRAEVARREPPRPDFPVDTAPPQYRIQTP